MNKCICGHEMTKADWKGQWVCHRCGRTKSINDNQTAREMFEKLGFMHSSNQYGIEYSDENSAYSCWRRIEFNFKDNTFYATDTYESMYIDIPTFKAIQKQLEELGWL